MPSMLSRRALAVATMAVSVDAARIILMTPPGGSMAFTSQNDCLQYLGEYYPKQPIRLYSMAEGCSPSDVNLNDPGIQSLVEEDDNRILVWVEEAAIDDRLRVEEPPFEKAIDAIYRQVTIEQTPLGAQVPEIRVHRTPTAGRILSIAPHILPQLDMYLPRFAEAVVIPNEPLPIPLERGEDPRLQHVLDTLGFEAEVASILSGLSQPQMRNDVRWLTGEASEILSRHSFSAGSRIAADWLKERFEETGAECDLRPFLEGFAPNVRCVYASASNSSTAVILGAHYDSRGSFGSTRAPGGDDDGSGTTQLLAIARAIKRKKVKFDLRVEIVAFAGEEQGLLGSSAYASELRRNSSDVLLMIQSDMLSYHDSEEPLQLGLPETIGSKIAAQLVANVSELYAPELTVGTTRACCSDHQSFHQNGFSATQMFERAGPIIDPYYHNSGDLSDRTNYDFDQLHSIAKVTFATLLHTAGYYVEDTDDSA